MPDAQVPASDCVDGTVVLEVLARVKGGDFTARMPLAWTGVAGKVADSLNEVIISNQALEAELARVSRVVGTDGELSQRAVLGGWTQSWAGSIESVNRLIDSLVRPTTEMQRVIGAVADGDLSEKISLHVTGEFLELKNTVNAMVDQLKTFAGEVTRVAREVGVEGKLGGQAQSKEIGGVWKDLTDNVNQLAANLTNQVRAISEVATAVTDGDLTRQVSVEASGEVAVLKDTLNEMIRNLRETTRQNVEQDWLKTNRERFTRMLQGRDDLTEVSSMVLSELATLVSAQHGVFYTMNSGTAHGAEAVLELQAGYGYDERKHLSTSFRLGEGLVGQCAKEQKRILLTDVPGDYVRINSGLGEAVPLNIIVLPVLFEGTVRAVVELASFSQFSPTHQAFLDSITESVGIVLNTIQASELTESLLKQSQSQAEELRSQQEELRGSNEDLARQATLLAEQNVEAEQKNAEVEATSRLIQEKISQLAVSSKYKSEFIANMSHELRTPLNSLMILAQQLEENPDHNLTETQVEYASVIHSSGNELLELLNSILDLAKVESGTVTPDLDEVSLEELRVTLLREFGPVARTRGLEFGIDLAPSAPDRVVSDPKRLRQILKNLLANAFKFTERGSVRMSIGAVDDGWDPELLSLSEAPSVIAFAVSDTGIGIDADQQARIFEAFAQGDGSTARLYGGTGLGLSISRELVGLLGGAIDVDSTRGDGSVFTVYLPAATSAMDAETPERAPSPIVVPTPTPTPTLARRPGATFVPEQETSRGTAPDSGSVEGIRFLVVDDDPRNLFAMAALLEQNGGEVAVVESGAAAIAALDSAPRFDIVLMDIMMPVMDGYDAIRAIREIEQHRSVTVIAVTGKVMAGERMRCMDAGANDYVPKPVDRAELFAALRPWLAKIRRERTAALPAAQPAAVPAMLATIIGEHTLEGLRVLVVDDDFTNVFAMTAVLERGGAVVTVAESGAEALACLSVTSDIDLVLMDIMMPVMDGYDTIRAIRALSDSRVLPIIAVTGKAAAGERERCLESGADDYIPKPVDTAALIAALAPWLPHARKPVAP